MRKYSCSGPVVGKTLVTSFSPIKRRSRTACASIAWQDRRRGVFLSSASPVQEQKAVGIISVDPDGVSRRNAGEVGSQAVYPRASNVARMPPEGKELAS